MSSLPPLTPLYKVLDHSGGRIWTVDLINRLANPLVHKISMYNQKVELQRLLDAQLKSKEKPAEGADMLHRTTEQLMQDMADSRRDVQNFGPGGQYDSLDIFGTDFSRTIPQTSEKEPFLDLRLLPYMYICKGLDAHSTHNESNLEASYIWEINTRPESEHRRLGLCPRDDASWSFWKYRWQTGAAARNGEVWRAVPGMIDERKKIKFAFKKFDELSHRAQAKEVESAAQWNLTHTQLIKVITNHAKSLMDVDKIVCFALGSLHYRNPRSFVQHLAAATIRNTIQALQKAAGKEKPIEVIAQDPAYDKQCVKVLQEELDIRAVTDLEGFHSLTKNTFVISIAPSAPILEIIADLTLDYGGPAAMLCEEISDDYLAPEKGPPADGAYGSEWSTQNAVKFKKRCVSEDFGDAQAILGMTYAEHEMKWQIPPAKMPAGAERAECQEQWSKALRVNFSDLKIYFRND